MKKIIDIIGALFVMGALTACTSCADECNLKHSCTEPDTLPMELKSDYLFRSGEEESYGYYTPTTTDTAYAHACAWYVILDGHRCAISKRVYELLDMRRTEHIRFEFHGQLNDSIDSLEVRWAEQIAYHAER